jgi:septum formation protein
MVVVDGRFLGKPRTPEEAHEMLAKLSGRSHQVVTGLCLLDAASGRSRSRAVVTRVKFRDLSRDEIERYVASGDPLDKAGGYGIQGEAGAFVAEIEGSFTNVVGLPVDEVLEMLGEAP